MDVWQTTEEVSLETYSPSFTSYKTQSAQNPRFVARLCLDPRSSSPLADALLPARLLHQCRPEQHSDSVGGARLARDDGISRRPRPGDAPTSTLIWGPISYTDAQAAGAHAPTSSVLLRPVVDPDVRSAAQCSDGDAKPCLAARHS